MKKALIVGSGGLKGAFEAGAVAKLCRVLGPDYFDAVYASSVGVFAATFFVANQPETIENTWKHLVDGRKLVNFLNLFRSRSILDLEYLIETFLGDEKTYLDTRAVFESKTVLRYVVTEYQTGDPKYIQPSPANLFELMKASSAVPFIYKPVEIDGVLYIDGCLSDALPIIRALEDGYGDITVVTNRTKGNHSSGFGPFGKILKPFVTDRLGHLLTNYKSRIEETSKSLENKNVLVIRPPHPIPLRHTLDTNKERLQLSLEMGAEAVRAIQHKFNKTT